jgi:hypothetical protein
MNYLAKSQRKRTKESHSEKRRRSKEEIRYN